jgi:hypothetical protein
VVVVERPMTRLAVRSPARGEAVLALAERTAGLLEALERSSDLSDVLRLDQQAGALGALARAARLSLAEQNHLAATRVRIQHRAGTLLRELASEPRPGRAKRARGRGPLRPQLPPGVLREHGVTGQESSYWQALAALPIDEVTRRLDELMAANLEVTSAEFYRRGRASLRKDRNSRIGASPAELRLRAALTNLARIRTLTTLVERDLAEKIARRLRDLDVFERSRSDLTTVVATCLSCGRERVGAAHRCACGGAWVSALR